MVQDLSRGATMAQCRKWSLKRDIQDEWIPEGDHPERIRSYLRKLKA